jgi:hypothetical protein
LGLPVVFIWIDGFLFGLVYEVVREFVDGF